ncbi:MAG: PBP1A family penicillin-binding protein [Actinobacteria bacterium]|nr:PBP1A family penicillin-binding protein [Actinomycetota bacterium]MBV9256126.1 PBP1A family penicillin-binding protein [Actinomycetota bacterium]
MPRTIVRYFLTVLTAGVGLAFLLILLAPQVKALATSGKGGKPDPTQVGEQAYRSEVRDRDGKLLAVIHEEENRSPVTLDKVPAVLISAVLDTEDDRFWLHGGVDLRSTVRALATDVSGGALAQGGSTITQQLVKNSLLTPEKTFTRKFKEAVLAVRRENTESKKHILEDYLNTVYFGNHAYGVQAAAETYFNKDVSQLNITDSAFLAGMVQNPIGYDPIRYPDAARARRDVVVDRMIKAGDLTKSKADQIRNAPLPTALSTPAQLPKDYFVDEVKQLLLDDPRFLGGNPQERQNAVNKGGLHIYTTLDPRLQADAEKARDDILPDTNGRFQAALVSLDSTSGAVRALVGGKDFEQSQYDLATHHPGRQPGSSFKPIVLATAIENGYSPNDTINGTSPCTIKLPGNQPYSPDNFEGETGGVMSLTDATVHSVNCAYVKLGALVGLDKVVAMSHKLGYPSTDYIGATPAVSLGAYEVPPLDQASVYSTFANDGVHHEPYFVEKITDRNGKTIFQHRDRGDRRISQQTARVVTQVLRQVVLRGTGVAAAVPGHVVAGKTGTSDQHSDAWFVGYTPQITTAVWMGSPTKRDPMFNVGGITVQGGTYPARIWSAYMTQALEPLPSVSFPAPDPDQIDSGHYLDTSKISHDSTTSSSVPSPSSTVPPSSTSSTLPGPTSTVRGPRDRNTTTTERGGGGEPTTTPTTRRRRGSPPPPGG